MTITRSTPKYVNHTLVSKTTRSQAGNAHGVSVLTFSNCCLCRWRWAQNEIHPQTRVGKTVATSVSKMVAAAHHNDPSSDRRDPACTNHAHDSLKRECKTFFSSSSDLDSSLRRICASSLGATMSLDTLVVILRWQGELLLLWNFSCSCS